MYVSLDIGGTTTRIAFSNDLSSLVDVIKYPTPKNFKDFTDFLNTKITSRDEEISHILLGIAGIINRHQQKILSCPNIPFIKDMTPFDLIHDFHGSKQRLKKTKITLENDATLAALGEATVGAGKSYNRVAYITASTGIGGSLILNKKIQDTTFNLEPGHHFVNHDAELGRTWEEMASGTSFYKRFGVRADDTDDHAIWNQYVKFLAAGLSNIAMLWRPDVIVLGGSIAKKAELFLRQLNEELNQTLGETRPDIKVTALGDNNGLIGGFVLLKELSK